MNTLLATTLLIFGLQNPPTIAAAQTVNFEQSASSNLHWDMRKLWSDHVIWTRDYIVAAVGDRPDAQAAANRLMKNQDDIGAAAASFYGKAAGDELTRLLKE